MSARKGGLDTRPTLGVGGGTTPQKATGSTPPPAETFRILKEDGGLLLTEAGNPLRKE